MELHEELKVPKGELEVPKNGNKRSPRCLEVPKEFRVSEGQLEVPEKSDGGPQKLKCGLEVPRGWTEIPEVLRVPGVGTEMEKESDAGPHRPQRVGWGSQRRMIEVPRVPKGQVETPNEGDEGAQGS